ncbi:MAG: phospho-N-acetylmuramoyl-pentapeptide-transferase [Caloramator sp.]|nr:phospho-N-acetylmuramoyl-pentapeptide-transferase [Caloramator sp.]
MQITILATIISFIISLLLGPVIIPALRKFKFGQSIREEGPKSHLKKAGTPTMGGIIFILSLIITVFAISNKLSGALLIALLTTVGYGFIGLLDDSIKIIKKRNLGLRAYQKLLGQILLALILSFYAVTNPQIGSKVHIPFTNHFIDFGFWYIPFMVFVIVGTTNAVNLTDGLDGLAASVTLIICVFFSVITYGLGQKELSIFCGALAGSLLGFLKFNAYPAEVFMGDTGSLALGGAISALAVLLKMPFIIVIVGGIYVIETLSVIIQVLFFKLTGKRIFKMAPLHHHFEQKGEHETKIVAWFVIFTAILCLIGFLAISI